jgi:hypothetical protein
MKVWRGFTLVFWTVILALCFAVILFHYSLQGSVLNKDASKERLANSGAYVIIRDTIVADKITASLEERYPHNKLIDKALVRETVAEVFPDSGLRKQIDPIIDVVYAWVDSKRPDVSFDIPIASHQEQFYRSLEVRLGKKIAALPSCNDYRYPPDLAVLNDLCLPIYVKASEVLADAMIAVRSAESPFDASFTGDTFSLPVEQPGSLKMVPTYLNYLWVLNYVAIAIAIFTSILLLVSRKLVGLMAVGVSAVLAGGVLWFIQTWLEKTFSQQGDPLLTTLRDALLPPLVALSAHYATITLIAGGMVTVASLGLWIWLRKRGVHA